MEYYAKLTRGRRLIKVQIYRSNDGIDYLVYTKGFVRFSAANKWAEGTIKYLAFCDEGRSFVREGDVVRRKF